MNLNITGFIERCGINLIKGYLLLYCLTMFFCVSAQKTDKVRLKNGDLITGEILSMKLAMLTYKMDGPGTISIKWEEVVSIKSDKVFEFTMRWGNIKVCTLDSLLSYYHTRSLDDIVEMIPIKDRFLKRLNGDVSVGFNYSKANQILQSNFNGAVAYKIPNWEFDVKLNSVINNYGRDTSLSKKQDISGNVMRNIGNKFYLGSSLSWQQNTELGLANRYSLSGSIGLEALTNNHNRLLFAGGLAFSQEQSLESTLFSSNLDAIFEAKFKRFYYSTPKFSTNADLVIFPGLSDWGRVRAEFDLDVSVEVFRDFTTGLTFYYNYDNHPPQGSVSNNDYGLVFTLGYTFGK